MRTWHRFILPIIGHFRKRRGAMILKQIPNLSGANVCDLGGSVHFWQQTGLIDKPRKISIVNISQNEVHIQGTVPANVEIVLYDGETIPFPDRTFDVLVCNSVLEHVPPQARAKLASEMRRISKQGFVQTPAFEFPIEPHFVAPLIHWIPKPAGKRLVPLTPWGFISRQPPNVQQAYWEEVNLLKRKEFKKLFPGTHVKSERFIGLRKSHYAIW